ncbi:alkaline phosphatase family protein [Haladaptatus sp. T7]|uniref:alkaline phosphatase family protein n=1 Tax=Haladaptatus sp. T7 TaxID=2029368 RepID=UPI0021A2522B|nr:alkaline phosphatase family protein [Haladaptatus sp. T7]GKZ14550.1 nucleotide pyrophosphatase [Haladaptatus sp. T7]
MTTRTVYHIGLDGVPPHLLEEAITRGYTPELADIRAEGASGTTKTVAPPLSMAAWCSFSTGRDPGAHGIYNFILREEGSYKTRFANGDILHANSIPIWDYLDSNGISTGIMNLMAGYPPSESSGFHIGDIVTSPPDGSFIYPNILAEEIEEKVTSYELDQYTPYTPDKTERQLQKYLDGLFRMDEERTNIGKYLIEQTENSVYSYVFSAPDSIQHCLAHIRDESHPEHEPGLVETYADKPLELLTIYDEFLGWLRSYMDDEDVLIVLSDHGHSPVHGQINLNSWLYNNGYLSLESTSLTKLKLFGYNHLFNTFEAILHRLDLFGTVKEAVAKAEGDDEDGDKSDNYGLKDLLTISRMDYDWNETVAYTIASGGQIYLNTSNDHPAGWITAENYDDIREALRKDLLNIRDPKTGDEVIENVYFGEEVYSDEYKNTRPDLIALPVDEYQIQYPQTMKTKEVFGSAPKPGSHSSEHDRTGIFLALGGGANGQDVKMDITDYAPTTLGLLNQPVPAPMTGSIRDDVFDVDATVSEYDGRVAAKRSVRQVTKTVKNS